MITTLITELISREIKGLLTISMYVDNVVPFMANGKLVDAQKVTFEEYQNPGDEIKVTTPVPLMFMQIVAASLSDIDANKQSRGVSSEDLYKQRSLRDKDLVPPDPK